jgi:hypothetical protein
MNFSRSSTTNLTAESKSYYIYLNSASAKVVELSNLVETRRGKVAHQATIVVTASARRTKPGKNRIVLK